MRNIFLTLCLALALVSAQAQETFRKNPPKPGPAPKIEMGEAEQFKLDNGLTVIVVEDNKLPRVSFQLSIDKPLRPEKNAVGLSSIAGQLLRTGTTTRDKSQIDEEVDFIGASLSASGSGIFASSLTKHKDVLLELMADVLYNPAFSQEEFDKIKKQTLSGLAASKEDPNAIAGNVASALRYGKDHPYGEVQTEATVENITLEMCKEYYEEYFIPNISYLVVVGDITMKEVKSFANEYFSDWEKKNIYKEDMEDPQGPNEAKVGFVDRTGAVQSVINITYPVELTIADEDYLKANVMNGILGATASARLFYNLREDKGFTYGAYSRLSPDEYVGSFNASASVRNEVTDSAVAEFMYELNRIRDEKVSEDELQNAKALLKGSFARQLESPQTLARFALNTIRYNLPKDFYQTYLQRIDKVTIDDVQAMAKKYIRPEEAHILVVGSKDEIAEKLKQFDADGEIDYYNRYGNKLQQATGAVPSDLTGEKVIANYIEAIGGMEKLKGLKDIEISMSAEVQGRPLMMTNRYKLPGKYNLQVSMMGNVMQEQTLNGDKATATQMGSTTNLPEEQVEAMKLQAYPVPEIVYDEMGIKTELKGLENVDGTKAYKVMVTMPNGTTSTDFFNASNFLKIRSVSVIEGMGQKITQQTDYSAYQEVKGIKFPFGLTISGMLPVPMKTTVDSVKINEGIADDVFSIE